MLLYEYPPKLDRQGKQLKAAHDLQERAKMMKNMYKNILLGIVMILIGAFVPFVIVILIGILNLAVGVLLYRYSEMYRDTACYTRIYDDRLEHCQSFFITGKKLTANILFEDIVRSEQTPSGNMIFYFRENAKPQISSDAKGGRWKKELEKGSITLFFQDTKAKLYLIENLSDKIKYPKKEYRKIEDEEDEDDLWDPLHKHGL